MTQKEKARSLILDYLSQREKKSDFKTPAFEIKKIGDTEIYVPKEPSSKDEIVREKRDEEVRMESADEKEKLKEPEEMVAHEPVSAKEEYVTSSLRELPYSTTRRPTMKELLGRFKVVKDGVEIRREILRKMAAGERFTPPMPQPALSDISDRTEDVEKAVSGNICPSCGRSINENNKLIICTECGKKNCEACGKYEMKHLKTDVYYNYEFDFPLCADCYERNYQTQRAIGRALLCFGSGNYTYAHYYALEAYRIGAKTKFEKKIKELLEKIEEVRETAKKKEDEWRKEWKYLSRRPGYGDPRWR